MSIAAYADDSARVNPAGVSRYSCYVKDQKDFAEQESVEAYVAIATPDGNKRAG